MGNHFWGIFSVVFLFQIVANADIKYARWTLSDDLSANFEQIVQKVAEKTGYPLTPDQFMKFEERPLSSGFFTTYIQTQNGIPVLGTSLRIWTHGKTYRALQVEAHVEDPKSTQKIQKRLQQLGLDFTNLEATLSPEETMNLVKAQVKKSRDDKQIRSVTWMDYWKKNSLVRLVKVKGRLGVHKITIRLDIKKVVDSSYTEFPQADMQEEEFSVPAKVYPIYEHPEGSEKIQERIPVQLKFIKKNVTRTKADPYGPLRLQKYFEDKLNPVLGETEEGRKQGYWAPAYVKRQGMAIRNALPNSANSFENGVLLQGRYATINIHPDAVEKFKDVGFEYQPSAELYMLWHPTTVNDEEIWEMIPGGSFLGKLLSSAEDALNRPATYDPKNNTVQYIKDGFDEVQVYYAINAMMESLQKGGFTDPDLSTRPYNAFLFDPEISNMDNAYYTDDTINFTTYSEGSLNYARDNSTIWHELGHGTMDRLMGDLITLADTGGLSEGMADFLAALVVADVTNNQPFDGSNDFRIINQIGFNLTNEVHDDGESYGGAMKDLLDGAIKKYGLSAIQKVTDLTVQSMRLCRNHPGLSANDWFDHMLYADELGNEPLRAPGELRNLIVGALEGRNFSLSGKPVASYTLLNGQDSVDAGKPGSRQDPIDLELEESESKTFNLHVALHSTEAYQFKYPVTLKVQFRDGPLEGAVHWTGEETQPHLLKLENEQATLDIPVTAQGKCDFSNRADGSCVDYVYLSVYNNGDLSDPVAKKRFYVRVKTKGEKQTH